MNRLTHKNHNDGHWYLNDGVMVSGFDKLAEYENTGLTPKQVKLISNILQDVGEEYNLRFEYVVKCVLENDYYKDIVQADKEKRLVILPCRPGTKIFKCDYGKDDYSISLSYFLPPYIPTLGKDIWLTYEEAEASLKKRGLIHDQ